MQTVLLLGVLVLVTVEPGHGGPADLQRSKRSTPGGPCPAGQYLSEENCKPCREGIDYTSSPNAEPSCILCTVCKEDKVIKSLCNVTRDTECQCKPGTFEDKDSTEICQTCSSCTDGEDEVTPCTPETNRKCVSKNAWASWHILDLIIGILVAVGLVLIIALYLWKTGAWRRALLSRKRPFPGHDQESGSLNALLSPQTTTNDSHHNTEPGKTQSSLTERKLLLPANGIDPAAALKSIFEYCSNEVPFNSWDRLMRQMGLTDNQIQVVKAETPVSSDLLYQMLQKWLHQTGLRASINDLLDALEAVGQRCALEKIEHYAVRSGKFIYQNSTAQTDVIIQET